MPLGFNEKKLKELFYLPTEELIRKASYLRKLHYGNGVFIRGLLEFTNRCRCNCKYCGLRRDNKQVKRYSLSEDEIIKSVRIGFAKGIKTFVLQGGEDPAWSTDRLCSLLRSIRETMGESMALTLSCGIKSLSDYKRLIDAGANRYLLRFETSDADLHVYLRDGISLSSRLQALSDLREAGFELGSGFMVGLPGETDHIRYENLKLCVKEGLHMVGIGPFISNSQTPLVSYKSGSMDETVRMTALLRILLPCSNIPATTAAGSLELDGRMRMLEAGANVLMPNITPLKYRQHYLLYPGKDTIKKDAVEELNEIEKTLEDNGWKISFDRGDSLSFKEDVS